MLQDTIDEIRVWHRRRCFVMEQAKRLDLALGSFLRTQLGWSRALPKTESERIKNEAKALMKKPAGQFASDILASNAAAEVFVDVRKRAERELEKLATSLPVWNAFGKDVRGFGPGSLAVIVGEVGDLSNYPKKGHLWKRMGLCVINGVAQGKLPKTAKKELWIEHGYNRQRRSRMWNIGDSMLKAKGHYRDIYLARKEYERGKAEFAGLTVAPAAKIPVKRKAEFISDGHIHRKAQRYMEQKLLRDLWRAWRDEGKAKRNMPLKATLPVPTLQPNEPETDRDMLVRAMDPVPTAQPNRRRARPPVLEEVMAELPIVEPIERKARKNLPRKAVPGAPTAQPIQPKARRTMSKNGQSDVANG